MIRQFIQLAFALFAVALFASVIAFICTCARPL